MQSPPPPTSSTIAHPTSAVYLAGSSSLGILALSSPSETKRFAKGTEFLRKAGVGVRVGLDPCAQYGRTEFLFSSDSAQRRAEALASFARDPSIGAILAVRGAYGAMDILPLLDFEDLRRFPKPLIGFSDTTALLVALTERAAWPCIHGPSFESAFCKAEESEPHRTSAEALLTLLKSGVSKGCALKDVALHPLEGGSPVPNVLTGKLIGGNLSTLAGLVGTPFLRLRGTGGSTLLFLEEISEKPYRIHRMLLQMKFAGLFQGIQAVLLGDFSGCKHDKDLGPDLHHVMRDIFVPLGIPVLRGIPSGHVPLNLPVPFGATATVRQAGAGHSEWNLSFSA